MKIVFKILPWLLVALFSAEIIAVLAPKRDGEFHVREFGRLPVLLNGRIQPFDSVARNSLLQIRSTGDVPLEEVPFWKFWHHPKKLKSTEWLLEVMLRPEQSDERPIFLIHHPELLSELKLEDKGVKKSLLRYYAYSQVKPVRDEIHTQAKQIRTADKDEKLWTPLQKQTMKLENALTLYERLKNSLRPQVSEDFAQELTDFKKAMVPGMAAFRAHEAGQAFDQEALDHFTEPLNHYFVMSEMALPLIVPPRDPATSRNEWTNAGTAIMESLRHGEIPPAMNWFATMATAYRQNQPETFNRAVTEYQQWLSQSFRPELSKGRREFFYNDIKAFKHAIIIYVFAFVLTGASLLWYDMAPNLSESVRRSALYLIILAWLVHTFALGFRMVLEGRPPVTNLYSSAIFIGWGAVVLGLVLEGIYKVGIGNAVAAFAGFVTLIIAHNLALGGDTMEMLRAVLDTNFWLATHVVVVTLGYASTFVAGLLAILYIGLGLFTTLLAKPVSKRAAAGLVVTGTVVGGVVGAAAGAVLAATARKRPGELNIGKALAKMVYAIVCFATLFSFVGTVLGGIWADQSWGRFWGWDPKENGALMIVLWNAIVLHARWGGLVRERGLMNMAVIGNIMTSFSWFGVNMLGIGLHSYGFMDAAFKWLVGFVISQLVIIGLGLVPQRYWLSFRKPPGGAPPSLPQRPEAPSGGALPAQA
jgi:cytochrome c-type biogenesis protein CcsB